MILDSIVIMCDIEDKSLKEMILVNEGRKSINFPFLWHLIFKPINMNDLRVSRKALSDRTTGGKITAKLELSQLCDEGLSVNDRRFTLFLLYQSSNYQAKCKNNAVDDV